MTTDTALNTPISIVLTSFPKEDNGEVYKVLQEQLHIQLIEQAMHICRNNQTQAAKLLGMNRGTFGKYLKLTKLKEVSQ